MRNLFIFVLNILLFSPSSHIPYNERFTFFPQIHLEQWFGGNETEKNKVSDHEIEVCRRGILFYPDSIKMPKIRTDISFITRDSLWYHYNFSDNLFCCLCPVPPNKKNFLILTGTPCNITGCKHPARCMIPSSDDPCPIYKECYFEWLKIFYEYIPCQFENFKIVACRIWNFCKTVLSIIGLICIILLVIRLIVLVIKVVALFI